MTGPPVPPGHAALLAEQTGRLADRLRSMALARLASPWEGGTRVGAACRAAQSLADLAAALEDPARPHWRDVPVVAPAGAGDLVAVCAHDAVAAAGAYTEDAVIPLRGGGRVTVGAQLAAVAADALELRRRL